MTTTAPLPETVMEQAIAWFDDLRSDSATDRRAFTEWLRRSPTHIEAFLALSVLHGGLSAACRDDGAWLEVLLDNTESNVLPFADQGSVAQAPAAMPPAARPKRRKAWQLAGFAAVLVVSVGFVAGLRWPGAGHEPAQYATALGEQRAVVLDDGSVLQLNTRSTVAVRFTATAREILLIRGEAIFDVKKDPERPFRVRSGAVTVEAIGTRFHVYRHAAETRVTVIEGRVAVASADTASGRQPAARDRDSLSSALPVPVSAASVELGAGEQLAIRPDGAIADVPAPADIQHTTAWTQRRVMFDDDTLDTVIAEFNRYNRVKLIVNDPALRRRRISGIFTVDNPQAFTEVLASMTPVRAIERADGSLEIVAAD